MKHKIFIVVAFIGLTSCMKVKKKGEPEKSPVAMTHTQSPLEAHGLQNEVFVNERTELEYDYVVQDDKMLHQVRFKAPLDWPAEVIVKKIDSESASNQGIKFSERGEWSDYLTSKNKVEYKFFTLIGKDLILLEEVEVLPVLDLHLTEDFNLAQAFKLNPKVKNIFIRNLEIEEQKNLFMETYSGKLVIQNLVSRSGFIRTFPADARAADAVKGRDGGQIKMEIKAGAGRLAVIMQGEHGGHGAPAQSPDAAIKGSSGQRGTPATFVGVPCNPYQGGTFDALACLFLTYNCEKQPGKSGDGARGLQGYPGQDGKVGGNSGTVYVLNDSSDLIVSIQTIEGSFGYGSAGGLGGEGGEPGAVGDGGPADLDLLIRNKFPNCHVDSSTNRCNPAFGSVSKTCSPGAPGAKGEWGPQGRNGHNGQPGIKQISCLYQNGIKVKCINE